MFLTYHLATVPKVFRLYSQERESSLHAYCPRIQQSPTFSPSTAFQWDHNQVVPLDSLLLSVYMIIHGNTIIQHFNGNSIIQSTDSDNIIISIYRHVKRKNPAYVFINTSYYSSFIVKAPLHEIHKLFIY